ncbi:STAS domain-containing protein [Azospirillum sp. SYSU D00513]|uniref:anti-sigma factor antagonist n=1 Tax=Azospirillum sp. SYSU D00513 TaxID=2812561 RepID=UPI001A97B795
MEIREERRGGVLVLAPAGRLDSGTAAPFQAALLRAVTPGPSKLVLDLGGLTHMAPAALRALLVAGKEAKPAGSRILLAAPAPALRATFAGSGLAALFEIHPTVEDALKALA